MQLLQYLQSPCLEYSDNDSKLVAVGRDLFSLTCLNSSDRVSKVVQKLLFAMSALDVLLSFAFLFSAIPLQSVLLIIFLDLCYP